MHTEAKRAGRLGGVWSWGVILVGLLMVGMVQGAESSKSSTLPSGVAAKVNGEEITTAAVDAEAARLKQIGTPVKDESKLHDAARAELIARELFRQQADKAKLDKDPEVLEAIKRAKEAAMIQAYVKRNLKPAAVTDDQVKAYFEQLQADLGPTEYKTRIIQVADEAAAKAALKKLHDGTDFAELAKQISLAASSKARGGELDWVSFKTPPQEGKTQGLPLPLAQAVLTLKPGEVAKSPIEVNGHWYVLKLDQSRPTKIPDYDQAKPALRKVLEARAIEQASVELVKSLMANAKIEQ